MWSAIILSSMLACAAYYALSDARTRPDPERVAATNLAASMGTYRQAVINFASAHPGVGGQTVDPSAYFPTGYDSAAASLWSNYIEPDGTIYVFSAPGQPLKRNITAEIVSLSQNSVLAGESGASDNLLHAPADVATPAGWANSGQDIPLATDYHVVSRIALTPSTAALIVPRSSPVWIAYRN